MSLLILRMLLQRRFIKVNAGGSHEACPFDKGVTNIDIKTTESSIYSNI